MDPGKDPNAASWYGQRIAQQGLDPASQAVPIDDGDGSRGCDVMRSSGVGSSGPRGDELAEAWPAPVDAQLSRRQDTRHEADDEAGEWERVWAAANDRSLVYAAQPCLDQLPNEILLQVFGFLDVNDLLAASRTNHLLRTVSLTPILHYYRLRRARHLLPPLLWSPSRPSLADLIAQSIFLTHTSVVSRRLARSLVSIRLSRRLAARPSPETLVERAVIPRECVPGMTPVLVSPAIAARRRDVERERVKDGLRRWIAAKWRGEVLEREEGVRRMDESRGVGRVWRLTRFWERVGRGEGRIAV
ncbi:hypothetical protein Purlil1_10051 [Purpureocillium lilacinum]|uniref:F-box domain-containing protein n=1 Tax=Purpureocillium lilacinum TaxID=33203 RepID=A0ABR0BNB4_PURLI|nr:hypothetical protein Purlil1_10051 [Purpureocillium lilacinum]GJN73779.1 hypothetical protein PLICBS_007862 [Purpureocillium lilacinum]